MDAIDWAAWSDIEGDGNSLTPEERKLTGGALIGDLVAYGGASFNGFTDSPRQVIWSDGGPPNPTTEGNGYGLYFEDAAGIGYEATFPADTTPRRAQLICGGFSGTNVKVTAILSDESVADEIEIFDADAGSVYERVITVDYAAGEAGQTLTIRVEINSAPGYANVNIQAAVLLPGEEGGDVPIAALARNANQVLQ